MWRHFFKVQRPISTHLYLKEHFHFKLLLIRLYIEYIYKEIRHESVA